MRAKTILITGAARRIGRAIARHMHGLGWDTLLHCRQSRADAQQLVAELNVARADSAHVLEADLSDADALRKLVDEALAWRDGLDALVNNAAAFFPTPLDACSPAQWDALMDANAKAPVFLALGLRDALKASGGSVVNIIDVHAERPLKNYALYSVSKAALAMATRALARELAPEVRCNGVSPGAVLWPEDGDSEANRKAVIQRTALKREGEPADIAKAVAFLVCDAPYITGQILAVDGGRTLSN